MNQMKYCKEPKAFVRKAAILEKLKQYEEAIEVLDEAWALFGDHYEHEYQPIELLFKRAGMLEKLGRFKEAASVYYDIELRYRNDYTYISRAAYASQKAKVLLEKSKQD